MSKDVHSDFKTTKPSNKDQTEIVYNYKNKGMNNFLWMFK